MMNLRYSTKTILLVIIFGLFTGCFNDNDDNLSSSTSVKDFVWKAMKAVYLYNANVEDLAEDRFGTSQEYQDFLNNFDSPEDLFESLIYDRNTVDRFSVITSDYFALEQQLSGVSKSNGAEFNFYYIPGSTTSVFGVVRLVLPNSNASLSDLTRGHVFNKINGQELTSSNISSLINSDSYTLNLAVYNDNGTEISDDDTLSDANISITLTKNVYTENPVYYHSIIEQENEKIGYLMYNGFVNEFDDELNQVFGSFKSEGIDHLILDLRYNSGGSIRTAAALGSMITGDFEGQVFTTLKYNETLSSNNYNFNFTNELSDGTSINSVNLNQLYVLTSNRSASASEMIINSLEAYIDVIQVGDETVGKSQASQIIYDSPNFGRDNANPVHTYALLPLIAKTVNKNNGEVPPSGIIPDYELVEKAANYGSIGNLEEPLLKKALDLIQGASKFSQPIQSPAPLIDSNFSEATETLMIVDN